MIGGRGLEWMDSYGGESSKRISQGGLDLLWTGLLSFFKAVTEASPGTFLGTRSPPTGQFFFYIPFLYMLDIQCSFMEYFRAMLASEFFPLSCLLLFLPPPSTQPAVIPAYWSRLARVLHPGRASGLPLVIAEVIILRKISPMSPFVRW